MALTMVEGGSHDSIPHSYVTNTPSGALLPAFPLMLPHLTRTT